MHILYLFSTCISTHILYRLLALQWSRHTSRNSSLSTLQLVSVSTWIATSGCRMASSTRTTSTWLFPSASMPVCCWRRRREVLGCGICSMQWSSTRGDHIQDITLLTEGVAGEEGSGCVFQTPVSTLLLWMKYWRLKHTCCSTVEVNWQPHHHHNT